MLPKTFGEAVMAKKIENVIKMAVNKLFEIGRNLVLISPYSKEEQANETKAKPIPPMISFQRLGLSLTNMIIDIRTVYAKGTIST